MIILIAAFYSFPLFADTFSYDCNVFVGQEVVTDKIYDVFSNFNINVKGVAKETGDEIASFIVDQNSFDKVLGFNDDLSISELKIKPNFGITDVKDGFSVAVNVKKSLFCPIRNPQCYWAYHLESFIKINEMDSAGITRSRVIKLNSEHSKDVNTGLETRLEYFGNENTERQPFIFSIFCTPPKTVSKE